MKILKLKFIRKPRLTDNQARSLTAEFLDGLTEPSQEQQLYDYYASAHVADDLKPYRDMFVMYASLSSKPQDRRRGHSSMIYSAVASLAILLAVGVTVLLGGEGQKSEGESIYAGSYIIRDGKKITDIKTIMPILHRANLYADSVMRRIDEEFPDDYETAVLEKALAGISDPQLKAELMANI